LPCIFIEFPETEGDLGAAGDGKELLLRGKFVLVVRGIGEFVLVVRGNSKLKAPQITNDHNTIDRLRSTRFHPS
jgi:hypothetical protein